MRVAVAGLGTAAARGHLPAIARLASAGHLTLAGAADPDARRRAEIHASFPQVPLFEHVEAMLAAVACDVLVVATEPSAHADLVTLALDRGLHVVCEKPLVVTAAQYDRVARAHVRRPDLGLVSVHQYRYAPTWAAISHCARLAARLGVPFAVDVEVERAGTDALAMSPWRSDVNGSGGMLADHGVHFLALAWTIDEQLDVLAAARSISEAGERSGASIRLGSGALRIQVRTGAPARRTRVAFHVASVALTWCDETFAIAAGRRTVLRRSVDGLANRAFVDSLYERLYRDVVRGLPRTAWRAHRAAEALVVGRALLALLEAAPASVAVPRPAVAPR